MTREIFIFAGEISADLHGEQLILALLANDPTLKIFGVGGPRMRSTPMECILSMEEFQVMGFLDVLAVLPRLMKHFYFIKKAILKRHPTAAVFIDYADFNMRMEGSLRKSGYKGKLIHYISPSVWAWRKKRTYTLSQNLDLLLVIYPFEVKHFAATSLKVRYVGNPLIKRLKDEGPPREVGLPQDKKILSLFPGSRRKEIVRNLPLMLEALKEMDDPENLIVLSLSHPRFQSLVEENLRAHPVTHPVLLFPSEHNAALMQASYFALAKSGTVTLELALHKVPTVVVYKISLLDEWIAHYVFRILLPFYCIVNIILDKSVFPEFMRHKIDKQELNKAIRTLFYDKAARKRVQDACEELKQILTTQDASVEAANAILDLIYK